MGRADRARVVGPFLRGRRLLPCPLGRRPDLSRNKLNRTVQPSEETRESMDLVLIAVGLPSPI